MSSPRALCTVLLAVTVAIAGGHAAARVVPLRTWPQPRHAAAAPPVPDGNLPSRVGEGTLPAELPTDSYVVRRGDTLWRIARRHGTSVPFLTALNGLQDPDFIRAGDALLVPEGRTDIRSWTRASADGPAALRAPILLRAPVQGRLLVTSPFGPRWGRLHEGVDLDVAYGAPIMAALPGRVAEAGWRTGYGRVVVLRHGRGVKTLYAHASRVLVEPGQWVRAGTVVARSGTSGHASGPHLHFEVHLHDRPVDPQPLLERRRK